MNDLAISNGKGGKGSLVNKYKVHFQGCSSFKGVSDLFGKHTATFPSQMKAQVVTTAMAVKSLKKLHHCIKKEDADRLF